MKLTPLAVLTSITLATTMSVAAVANPAMAASTAQQASAVKYTVKDVTKTTHVVNYARELGRCASAAPGMVCSITRTVSATNSYEVSFGLTPSFVASELKIGYSSTTSISISCQSPKLASGRTLRAYPMGTQWGYRIQRTTANANKIDTSLSGALTAFKADNAVLCAVG